MPGRRPKGTGSRNLEGSLWKTVSRVSSSDRLPAGRRLRAFPGGGDKGVESPAPLQRISLPELTPDSPVTGPHSGTAGWPSRRLYPASGPPATAAGFPLRPPRGNPLEPAGIKGTAGSVGNSGTPEGERSSGRRDASAAFAELPYGAGFCGHSHKASSTPPVEWGWMNTIRNPSVSSPTRSSSSWTFAFFNFSKASSRLSTDKATW